MCSDLESQIVTVDQIEISSARPCPITLSQFQPVSPPEVDKVLDHYRATTTFLDLCPAWVLKAARPITMELATSIISASLWEDQGPSMPSRRP